MRERERQNNGKWLDREKGLLRGKKERENIEYRDKCEFEYKLRESHSQSRGFKNGTNFPAYQVMGMGWEEQG